MRPRFSPDLPEISDAIVAFDPETLTRQPIVKRTLIESFLASGNRTAARIVSSVPERNGFLDEAAVDRLLVRVHCEMQGLSEEFQHGARVWLLLEPLLKTLRAQGVPPLYRVADIGCGTGYVLRWLAAFAPGLADVELIGADFNPALIAEAQRLAKQEGLTCQFIVGNAFRLEVPATIFLSTGVLHHFRGSGLRTLLGQHEAPETHGFLHYDFRPSLIAPFGSWLFHVTRMREALSRHDGVLSARRAYTADALCTAARENAPGFLSAIYSTRIGRTPIPCAFHTLVGVRPPLWDGFVGALGRRAVRLGELR